MTMYKSNKFNSHICHNVPTVNMVEWRSKCAEILMEKVREIALSHCTLSLFHKMFCKWSKCDNYVHRSLSRTWMLPQYFSWQVSLENHTSCWTMYLQCSPLVMSRAKYVREAPWGKNLTLKALTLSQ